MAPLDTLQGMTGLWMSVVDMAHEELLDAWPGAAEEIHAASQGESLDTEESVERALKIGRDLARTNGARLTKQTRTVLEHGVAMFVSLDRLRTCAARYASLADTEAMHRDIQEADAVLDLWVVYVLRFMEATEKFTGLAARQLGLDDAEPKAWLHRGKKSLARIRMEVIHGNPVSVIGINNEGLWEPMILLGAAREPQAVESMIALDSDVLNRRIEAFSPRMRSLTIDCIASANRLCLNLQGASS